MRHIGNKMIDTDCISCVFCRYELDTNWAECLHPDFDPDKPNECPGYYSKDDARDDAKLRFAERG